MAARATGALEVRAPRLADEEQVYAVEAELAADGFGFSFVRQAGESWPDCFARLEREREGQNLADGRVPATMLFGLIGDEVIGRVSVRHELTPVLEKVGGHIGYVVRPTHRRRGYATRLLAAGLDVLRDLGVSRALVTCDEDNIASASTIERNGGILENVVSGAGGSKRRYWIDVTEIPVGRSNSADGDRPVQTVTLWRPTGPEELALVEGSGWREWPPRLPEQPIFYPVLNEEYATRIAHEWNVPASGVGYVTRFEVRKDFLDQYDVHQAGGETILEYWIPAEDLPALNASIVGLIEVVAEFR